MQSDTDESEGSNYGDEEEDSGDERAPLVAEITSDEEEEGYEMDGIDGDEEEEEEDSDDNSDVTPTPAPERPTIVDEFTGSEPLPRVNEQPLGDLDWRTVVLARVCLHGSPANGVQAVILQTKDGTEAGAADKSVKKSDMTKEVINEQHVMIEQPMGYVIRVTGYHGALGKPCLLQSLKLEFMSGQVIELQGEKESYKGEPFIVEDLEENFYLSTLEFENGKCIGYSGYTTETPLHELMEEESLPDEDKLNKAHEHQGGYINDRAAAKVGAPDGGPNNDWWEEDLPAVEMPTPEEDEEWRISHICLLGDLGLRGCIIHYYDGRRYGFLLRKHLEQTTTHDYKEIEQSRGRFIEVHQPGGYLKQINGYQMADDAHNVFLCHSLQLEFESGQIIDFAGDLEAIRGQYFSYDCPKDFYVNQLRFDGNGKLSSVAGVRTEHLECPPMDMPEVQDRPKKSCCCC